MGLNTATYALSYQYARVAIDLALARGGDQAVIKDCNGITYFGGKKEQTAKNTRVKARVKADKTSRVYCDQRQSYCYGS